MSFPFKRVFEKALLSKFTEEEFLDLFSKGELFGTVHTCIGQELSGAIISEFLTPEDTVVSNHRCHGHFLSFTDDLEGLINELMGKDLGVCGGLGGSQHLCKGGFYSNGIQGGIAPLAAGLAWGHKIIGKGQISVLFIGDGTLGEGVLYEVLNIVSKWSLPLLIVLEDNKYSQSTSQEETLSGSILMRAEAFGIDSAKADTWNYENLYETARVLVENMRKDSRPKFLHIETFRLKAHSKGDDNRPEELVASFAKRDPLNMFLAKLSKDDEVWVEAIHRRISNAVISAKKLEFAMLPLEEDRATLKMDWIPLEASEPRRYIQALNEAFMKIMGDNHNVFMLGEDIKSPYGGAFKATKALSDIYPERVKNTPISEACIVGMAGGLGLMGFTPIVEIMFGDFLGLAFDQLLNHISKFHQMYNQQVHSNAIVRTPMGGGRGYGPTHSQTLDKHFIGMPGLRVVALNEFIDPEIIYRKLVQEKLGPALVIENKKMYGAYLDSKLPDGFAGFSSSSNLPDVLIRPNSNRVDITLLGYGGMLQLLLQACDFLFEEHDLVAQALVVSQIYPFKIESYLDTIFMAEKLLIVEEGQMFAGFGSEVLAQLMESKKPQSFLAKRISAEPFCIPTAGPLEAQVLPNLDKIVIAALAMGPA